MTRSAAGEAGTRGYDFATFGLSDMVHAAAELRICAEQATDFAAAARSVVERLRAGFVDADGEPVLQLIRLFSTCRYADLPGELQQIALDRLAGVPAQPDIRCLTLVATAGVQPNWNDPAQSPRYRVIPLPSREAVTATPMISALISELGLTSTEMVEGAADSHGRFGVFHVPTALGSRRLPDQGFVTAFGISSVLGFGGVLTGGDMFCVVMFSRVPIPVETAEKFRALAVSVRAGLLTHARTGPGDGALAAQRDALREHLTVLEETSRNQAADLEEAVDRLRAEADLVDTLQTVGQRLTAQLDLDALVQDATDAARRATGAAFAAFFYNVVNEYGGAYMLYTLSGAPKEAFARFPMPRNTPLFSVTFTGTGTVRCDDVAHDPRYGNNPPHDGMPAGHLPVSSYLAVPVISPSSREVLGGLFFGHPKPGRFTIRHQHLAEGIAGYTAIALDNARLFARQRTMATELARSMLPVVPRIPGLDIVSCYRPAALGSEVGGDWFDVIELPAGRSAFVIGDVVGRGVAAAAVMGQIRTAVRSYALLDLPPADVLRHVSALAHATPGASFITCLYAVHDPADQTLTFANAGHPPAVLLHPDGSAELIAKALGMPLGVGDNFVQCQTTFPPGVCLALYTDGLVEHRSRDLSTGIDALVAGLQGFPADLNAQSACDQLIDRLTGGRHDDDVALLYITNTGGPRRVAALPLSVSTDIAATARAFVARRLSEWELAEIVGSAVTVTSELVTNAVKHTNAPVSLHLHHGGRRLTIEVTDRHDAPPRRFEAGPEAAGHRGLQIVQAFATRWGSRPTPEGKVVWAELTVPPGPLPTGRQRMWG